MTKKLKTTTTASTLSIATSTLFARFVAVGITALVTLLLSPQLSAFCGFYVAKADTGLYNKSSQVVYVRDDDRNVVTMASDYQGKAKDFAMVIPVPTVLKRNQIHITNNAIIKHLDDFSSPRLVEYHDDDPCQRNIMYETAAAPAAMPAPAPRGAMRQKAKNMGVTIEAQYTVGEYDILLLSAKESGGLVTWLTSEGYKLPKGAEPVIGSYLKQDMKFFVAKVNLKKFDKSGYTKLRPIQIAYTNKKFMLPIRLGTVNAQGKQELFIYALTRKGRVETTNYRTVKLPTDVEIPGYIKEKKIFGKFYKDMFKTQVEKQNNKAVFLEYAWNMNWCDPCAADPLSNAELKELGVFWIYSPNDQQTTTGQAIAPRRMPSRPKQVYISRLHLRYDRDSFPEDLMFQTTGNTTNFQGRYVIRHPFTGKAQCDAGDQYFNSELPKRFNKDAKTLAKLTNWNIAEIRKNQSLPKHANFGDESDDTWIESLWK